jgi:hypothetical protein
VKSLRAVQTSLALPETFKAGLAILIKAVVNGYLGENFLDATPLHASNFDQISTTNQYTPTKNVLSPTQYVRSHLRCPASLLMLTPIRITLLVCTEIEVTHGTAQVSSHQALMTT